MRIRSGGQGKAFPSGRRKRLRLQREALWAPEHQYFYENINILTSRAAGRTGTSKRTSTTTAKPKLWLLSFARNIIYMSIWAGNLGEPPKTGKRFSKKGFRTSIWRFSMCWVRFWPCCLGNSRGKIRFLWKHVFHENTRWKMKPSKFVSIFSIAARHGWTWIDARGCLNKGLNGGLHDAWDGRGGHGGGQRGGQPASRSGEIAQEVKSK